jgi:hypothetical protein
MLLSFAQFEREIAGERIRDKIAASKAKGMWMGGNVPLGYDVKDRKLIVNGVEAATVRMIFQRYADLGSVRALGHELDRLGVFSKRREGAGGIQAGGDASLVAPSIRFCRTTFIAVRSHTRATSIPDSTRRSLTLSSGRSCKRSCPTIGKPGRSARLPRSRVCWPDWSRTVAVGA